MAAPIHSPVRTYCTARQASRRDDRERTGMATMLMMGVKTEDEPSRRSISWHSKFVI